MLALAERALAPLDAVRSTVLRAVGRRGRVLFASRDARVLLYATASTAITLVLALAAPRYLLVLGPVVLGVPHLVADVRYLVARPGLHRRRGLAILVGVPLAVSWFIPTSATALVAVCAVAVAARGAWWRRALVFAAGAALVAGAYFGGRTADLIAAHGHNVVALVVWAVIAHRSRTQLIPIALVLAGCAVIAVAPVSSDVPWDFMGLGGLRWAALFAFCQASHYMVWLRLLPEEARERAGIRSFAATLRALVRDLGGPLVILATVLALATTLYALVDASAARNAYLRVAFFHGFLELAALALVAIEGAAVLRRA
jgi:hypothetical protein